MKQRAKVSRSLFPEVSVHTNNKINYTVKNSRKTIVLFTMTAGCLWLSAGVGITGRNFTKLYIIKYKKNNVYASTKL